MTKISCRVRSRWWHFLEMWTTTSEKAASILRCLVDPSGNLLLPQILTVCTTKQKLSTHLLGKHLVYECGLFTASLHMKLHLVHNCTQLDITCYLNQTTRPYNYNAIKAHVVSSRIMGRVNMTELVV